MVLLLALVVVVGVAALLGAGLFSAGTERSGRRGAGLTALLTVPVGIVVVVVILGVLVVGVGGLRGGGDGEQPDQSAPSRMPSPMPSPSVVPMPSPSVVSRATTTTAPLARVNNNLVAEYRAVAVRATLGDGEPSFRSNPPVGGLTPGDVVQVLAAGFDPFERGTADQCVIELGRQTACTSSSIPVQFDSDGSAAFLFVVRGDVAPGGCRSGQPTCVLRVRGADSGRAGRAQTVIGDTLVYGQMRVTPDRGLAPGQAVDVAVTGFPAGTTATAVVCAPIDLYDVGRCSTPGAGSTFAIDGSGSGRTSIVVERSACGARGPCAVVVVVNGGYVVPGSTVPIGFSRGGGVSYTAGRVLGGVAVAVVLAGIALLLVLRMDWTKPTEAATPELDAADLRADENLDALFGTDAELDERDPIPW